MSPSGDALGFTIESNVLKGPKIPYPTDATNYGKSILEYLENNNLHSAGLDPRFVKPGSGTLRHLLIIFRGEIVAQFYHKFKKMNPLIMTPLRDDSRFTIENNILKGVEVLYDDDITSVGKFVLDGLKKNPEFVGLIDAVTGEEYTYRKMRDRSVRCALWMRSHGLLPRDVISVCSTNRLDYMTPCFAALYLGAIYSTWNIAVDAEGLLHRINVTKSKMVFTSEASVKVVAEAVKRAELDIKIIVFGSSSEFFEFDSIIAEPKINEVDRFVYVPIESLREIGSILFSSGTTGKSKGVALSHGHQSEALGIAGNVCLKFANADWCCMVETAYMHISLRVSRLITPAFEDPVVACALIEKQKATWLLVTPTMINRWLKSGAGNDFDLSSVRRVIYTGSSLSIPSRNAFAQLLPNAEILAAFGMTESGSHFSLQTTTSKPGSCGQLLANSQLKVVDLITRRTMGVNQRGELLLKSPFMMNCYYNNPQATDKAFDDEGWLITGDLGYFDEDGEIFVIDRLKEVIRCAHYDICPYDIESVVLPHPGVKEVAVVGQPRDDVENVVVIFVIREEASLENGKQVTENEILDLVPAAIRNNRRLRTVVKFIEEIPKTGNCKIQRLALRELAKSMVGI